MECVVFLRFLHDSCFLFSDGDFLKPVQFHEGIVLNIAGRTVFSTLKAAH